MQRPPFLFTRPTYEWINRVNQKHNQFISLQPSPQKREAVSRHAATSFVASALRLAAHETFTEADLLQALGLVESFAESAGPEATLTPELLLRLNDPLGRHSSGFRTSLASPTRLHTPPAPEHLAAAVEGACRWFTAESFAELNPVEQASIVFLRMIEIRPFEQSNEPVALLAASLFTLRRRLPPIIIEADQIAAFRAALDEGLRMDTRPMVELMAEATERALGRMIDLAHE